MRFFYVIRHTNSGKEDMAKFEIIHPDDSKTNFEIEESIIAIGRSTPCKLLLDESSVSRKHAAVFTKSDGIYIKDLESSNGTYINGKRIEVSKLHNGDEIKIGVFTLIFRDAGSQDATMLISDKTIFSSEIDTSEKELIPGLVQAKTDEIEDPAVNIRRDIYQILLEQFRFNELSKEKLDKPEFKEKIRQAIIQQIDEKKEMIGEPFDETVLTDELMAEVFEFGPITEFLKDEKITRLIVNGPNNIFIEKSGKYIYKPHKFLNDFQLTHILKRLLLPAKRELSDKDNTIDVWLDKTTHIHAILPPLSCQGTSFTIRKYRKAELSFMQLISNHSINEQMLDYLKECIQQRKNIIISGPSSSGKTTLLNILCTYIPESDRIAIIEQVPELTLDRRGCFFYEIPHPPELREDGFTVQSIINSVMNLGVNRVILSECSLDGCIGLLEESVREKCGWLTTMKASSSENVILQFEESLVKSKKSLSPEAVQKWLCNNIDVIVQLDIFRDGSRRVSQIVEVNGIENSSIVFEKIFRFEITGANTLGMISGRFMGADFDTTAPKIIR